MHSHTLDGWKHDHVFLGGAHERNERRTWFVVSLTAAMRVAEIASDLGGLSHVTVEVLRRSDPH